MIPEQANPKGTETARRIRPLDHLSIIETTEPITLPDGHVLDARQSSAAFLRATEDMTLEQIAEQAGYASASACSTFLRSDKGKQGVRQALTQHLNEGARVGLQAMIRLAKGAKSENVRQLAAADLMDRAQLRLDAGEAGVGTGGAGGREVNISINLSGKTATDMKDVTIDMERLDE